MKVVLRPLAAFLLWNLAVGSFLLFTTPEVGLPIALVLSAAFLWGYLLRPRAGSSPARRWATLRLRPLRGDALRWTLLAVPVLLLLSWTLGDVYTRLVAVPPESLNPFEPIMRSPLGRLTLSIFAIAVAPVIEEFLFRGLIQRELERRRGITRGIAIAAALFAMVHLLPWVFPLHFFLGVAFGFAVYATRSIWSAVILHAANNAAAMMGVVFASEVDNVATVWEIGVTVDLVWSATLLLAAIFLAAWIARKLLEAGGHAALRVE
ncbi:MAG: CPBP family intramembrane glutamic endopeptidase [Gemmatimonadota bacterium]